MSETDASIVDAIEEGEEHVASRQDAAHDAVLVEHDLDTIASADWVVDLGPEGGDGGGRILVAGTPEQVAKCKASHTGRFLKPLLERKS